METREKIISRARKLLMNIGPTSMTMDMVAKECGMSKRTLYEIFPDKKTLIMQCLATDHEMHLQEARRIYNEASNCFDALFVIFKSTRKHLDKRSQAFIDDVRRLYPEISEKQKESEHLFVDQLGKVLEQAQEEELVIKQIDTRTASFLFITLLHSLHRNPGIEEMGLDPVHVYEAAFINFLRGIATAKGAEIIDIEVQNHMN